MSDISNSNKIVLEIMKQHALIKAINMFKSKEEFAERIHNTMGALNKGVNIDKHETGAQRSTDCKEYNYWLISPIALTEIALSARYIDLHTAELTQCINKSLELKYRFLSGEKLYWIAFSALCIMKAIELFELDEKINMANPSIKFLPRPEDWKGQELRYDLVPFHGLEALAKRMHLGATNYGIMNWENGFPISDLQDHSIRHIRLYQNGDRSDDHLGAALWGDFATIHSYYKWPELNKLLRGPNCSLTEEHKKYYESFKKED